MQCLTFRKASIVAALVLLTLSSVLLAEVSDKEPTSDLFWKIGLTTAILCLIAAHINPWLDTICWIPAAIWYTSLSWNSSRPTPGRIYARSKATFISSEPI